MPYVSDAQRRYFNANRSKLQRQGVDVDEWNSSSRGKKLPEKVKKAVSVGINEAWNRIVRPKLIDPSLLPEKVKRAAFIEELYNIKIGSPLLSLVARHQLKPKVNDVIEAMEHKARQGAEMLTSPHDMLLPSPPESWAEVMEDIRPSIAASKKSSGGMGLGRL